MMINRVNQISRGSSMKTILNKSGHDTIPEMLPVIPTMDVVVFPHMIVPLTGA